MTIKHETALLALSDQPALLVDGQRVSYANDAAIALLGAHIIGEDVRVALRSPAAIAPLLAAQGGRAQVKGLSVSGSVWDLVCHILADGTRLVFLEDLSVSNSVARAHADFVANASHELRTPLAAILGYVETLADERAGGDPDTRTRFLSIIQREARRMQTLVEDLMSLSRIEAGKHEVPADAVDLVKVIREISGEFPGNAAIGLESNANEAIVAGDRPQLAQALRNVIDNAVKYGKPGGPVSISLEATETGWLAILVRDEGEGIGPDHLPRLTERFYRADEGRSREMGGTGLGLSIVKHIVERHRGRLDISSRQGDGTTVSIMLPLKRG